MDRQVSRQVGREGRQAGRVGEAEGNERQAGSVLLPGVSRW